MQRYILLCAAMCLLFIHSLFGANPVTVNQFINHEGWSFTENQGQLQDNNGNTVSDVKFYGRQGRVNLFCRAGKISLVFTSTTNAPEQISEASGVVLNHQKNPVPSSITINRTDLVLENSNINAKVIASDQQETYLNYVNATGAESGFKDVKTFKTITYKNIYPNIDMVLHSINEGLKYEFVVYPGGNVNDIRIKWNGINNLKIAKNGGISYAFALGSMVESSPVCYQGKNIIGSNFIKSGELVGFNIKDYDRSATLVIDPSLTWGTYFGGGAADVSNAVATDVTGNVYITGYTLSTSGIATSGAFLTSNAGTDAFIAKFNNSGALKWATYYGNGSETGTGIAIDNNGNAFITGNTSSSAGIATSGAYQTSYGGSIDAFLAKFDSTGVRKWGTYFGGSGADGGYGVAVDGSGNVYFTGKTASSSGIATSGANQTSLGGSSDAFLAEFTNSGACKWSTYYGGTGADIAYGIAVNGSVNIYITGSTNSKSSMATAGAFQTAEAGSNDAFLAKFNGSGSLQWGTYFGGNSDDFAQGVALDGFGNAVITGYTGSSGGIATSGAYQTFIAGGGTDCFLAEFNSSGSRQWGTYYGGVWADNSYGIATDGANSIYITGVTASLKLIATSGAYQSSYAGNNDAFLAKFTNKGALQVGTYYGGSGNDQGQGVAVYNNGNVFLTGYTVSTSAIATSGAFMTSNAGGSSDAFLAKFNFINYNDAGVDSVLSPKGTFCPGTQSVKVNFGNYGLGTVKKVTINWSVNRINQTAYSWTGTLSPGNFTTATIGSFNFFTGNDTIRAWTSNPNGVTDSSTSNDSSLIVDFVNPLPSATVIPSTAICSGSSISIGGTAVSGNTYLWSSSPSGFSSTSANPSVSPTGTTFYTLTETITATGCTNSHTDTISLPHSPVSANKAICIGFSATIGATSYPANMYSWTSSPSGFTSTSVNPTVSPNVTTKYYLKDSISAGCKSVDSITVTVNPLPLATIIPSTAICSGHSINIGTTAISGHTYSWTSTPTGFTSTNANPSVSPTSNTVYALTETITGTGCINSHSDTISLPLASVIANNSICLGSYISIGGASYPGNTYSWTSTPSGFTSTSSNPSVSPSSSTIYHIKDSVSGCVDTNSVTITMKPLPVAKIAANATLCPGGSISLGALRVTGDNYLWTSIPKGFTSTSSNPYVSPTSTTIYIETETNPSTGCSRTNSDTITMPFAFVRKDTTVCSGTKLSLGGTSYKGNYYSWFSSPSGFSSSIANPSTVVNVSTVYYLIDTTASGCGDTNKVKITVNPAPSASVLPSTAICSGGSLSIGASSVTGDTYSWSSSPSGFSSTVSNPTASPSVTTIYYLTETNPSNGCSRTNSDTISFPGSTTVLASTTICSGYAISLGGTSYSGNNYSWTSSPSGFTSSIANPVVTPTSNITYYFKDTVLAGCVKKTQSSLKSSRYRRLKQLQIPPFVLVQPFQLVRQQ